MNENLQEIKQELQKWPEIVKEYIKPSRKKSWTQVANTFLPFFGLLIASYLLLDISLWLSALISFFNAFFLGRILIIQHDCGHRSFFKDNRYNNVLGVFCSLFTLLPYTGWRKQHDTHHRHTGVLDEDVRDIGAYRTMNVDDYQQAGLWQKVFYKLCRHWSVVLCIGPIIYYLIQARWVGKSWNTYEMRRDVMLTNIAYVLLYGIAFWFVGWEFLIVYGVGFAFFCILSVGMFYVQHQHEETYREWKTEREMLMAALKGSTFFDLGRLGHWLTGNIGYHHIHHLCALIPNYNLKQCYDEHPLLSKLTKKLTLKTVWILFKNALWDETEKRMITFREYKKLYKKKAST